jgi:hypothetical protein
MYAPAMTPIAGEYGPPSLDPGNVFIKQILIPRFRVDIPRYKVDSGKRHNDNQILNARGHMIQSVHMNS